MILSSAQSRSVQGRAVALIVLLLLVGTRAEAWPHSLTRAIARDAWRLLPGSLARLLSDREEQIAMEWTRPPLPLQDALVADLIAGDLRNESVTVLDDYVADVLRLLAARRVSEGLERLGALARFPADLSDPVLAVGSEGYPAGVAREYYAFIELNLDKIPVTLTQTEALGLRVEDLGPYWRGLLRESRRQSTVLRTEMIRDGRVLNHRQIDYRSPVFAVSSLSYSRAVTAVAATWLAVWRKAGGDQTRMRRPDLISPSSSPASRNPFPEVATP